jgi:hypothetical protein
LFAESMIRYSPRQVTLAPGAAQTIRILLRKPAELAPGEYRSHLLFQAVADAADKLSTRPVGAGEVDIQLKALVSVSVPVIVRHGETKASAEFAELALIKGDAGEPTLSFEIHRAGNRSLYGDLIVTYAPPGAPEVVIGRANGVAIYSPNTLRRARLALKPPASVDLARSALRLVYRERPEDGGKLLAEKRLQPP